MALIVDGGRLITAVERGDLAPELPDDLPAREVGTLTGRLVSLDSSAPDAFTSMLAGGRRRFAVTDETGALAGLLCLKKSSRGFCSDGDVAQRSP
jgi:hypothetical protein